MRKGAIITAVILIAAGLLIAVGGLAAGGSFKPMEYETKTYPVSEPVTGICLKTQITDVQLMPSPDGTTYVSAGETDGIRHTVTVQNGTLTIETVDERSRIDRILPLPDLQMNVYLPATSYRELSAVCRTGCLEIAKEFTFESVDINCSTGDVRCGASASGCMKIETSTGDIRLDNVKAEDLWLIVSTGRIEIGKAEIQKGVLITVTTGRLEINGLSCESLTSKGSTGRVTLRDIEIKHALWIERSTGDVRLENVGAETVTVHTSTGNVTGTLQSDLYFVTETSTGKVSVPETHGSGRCEIKTSTGDIQIAIAGVNDSE